ncbi:MAG: PilZ domain-containing protein [Myxococcales bacterium]|nr:PilZ domain-containing protein [Myxococcales bacterium]
MQVAAERRTATDFRVPFEASIRLAHHGFDTPLEADGLNLSGRGLKLRSQHMPEIGTWLSCRFQINPDAPAVFREGEVVWTSQKDGGAGEFGVRFAEVDEDVERWVRDLAEESPDGGFGQEHSEVREVVPESDTPRLADYSMSTELYIDALRTPILTRSAHQASDLVILEQDLPFLRINTGVSVVQDEHTALQRGRLASVDLQMVDDMPRLTLGIVYDRGAGHSKAPAAIPSVSELNVLEGLEESLDEEALRTLEDAPEVNSTFEEMLTPVRLTTPETVSQRRGEEQECRPFQVHERDLDEAPSAAPPARLGRTVSTWMSTAEGVLSRASTAIAQGCVRLVSELSPRPKTAPVGRRMSSSRQGGGRYRATFSRTLGTWSSMMRILVAKTGLTLPASRASRRRTAPAPRRQGLNSRVGMLSSVPKVWLWASVVLAAVLVLTVLWRLQRPAATEPAPMADRATALSGRIGDDQLAEADYGTELDELPAERPVDALKTESARGVDPLLESALPAPSYEAGPVAPTRYPSVADAAAKTNRPPHIKELQAVQSRPSRAPGETRAPAPRTIASQAGSKTFGTAKLSNGTRLSLRMSRNMTELKGTRLADGFRVIIPGALSLDKAGSLAQAHAKVLRAAILNHGDRSELSVLFKPGKTPAYRVQAKGSSLEIVIAN